MGTVERLKQLQEDIEHGREWKALLAIKEELEHIHSLIAKEAK